MRDAFERAIVENPDDLASYSAYADWLQEQGDPRGEFMQVQLALEDESRPKTERDALKSREAALLKKHAAEWVGDWANHPNVRQATDEWTAPDGWVPYRFTRGVLSGIEVGDLSVELARKIVTAPQLGLVRDLTVHGIANDEGEYEEGPDTAAAESEVAAHYVLVRWPQLRYLRTFRFGGCEPYDYDTDGSQYRSHTPGELIADFVEQMPDIEELYIMAHFRQESHRVVRFAMPNLRVLLLYHGWHYPLDQLAENDSLTNLRELYCHPHAIEFGDEPYIQLPHLRAICRSPHLTALTHLRLRLANFGDAGVTEIIQSGLLKRLQVLDLRHGLVTDDGARALAAAPDVKNLRHLDLSWNRLTSAGVAALTKTGIGVALNCQQPAASEAWETFGHGDIE